MKKTTQGFLAGAAGLGLLLGGSTFALWSDSADLNDQRIASGNLEVQVSEVNWRDISPDRTDKGKHGHEINLERFRIIPGDKIQARYPIKVALEGENMVAKLKLAEAGKKQAVGELAAGLEVEYEVKDRWGRTVDTSGRDGSTIYLASKDNGNPGNLPRVDADGQGRAEFTVTVTVTFKEGTSNRDLTQAQALLKDSELELQQVRSGAHGYKGGGHGGGPGGPR
ncbi:alternate-type signal peptide domain-containing protein [Enteractinococcus coprophilus]|uniref:Alternate signal-mediated exported protein n=1 Tax=Enteractinococcus coprophilus TaxID=1027633 RepID=A0A543ANE5_9MICC|nr:alternate-type signal peptide domain-containing protein [Enteractinococcus coprophilus]TQL74079.1 alternate signal-mediated exported protein [Enteractinococcus coprophilus]